MEYKYGMRLRGYSIGCQPDDVKKVEDDESGRYHDILVYDRKLTDKELKDFELDDLNKIDEIEEALYMNNVGYGLNTDQEELKNKYRELFDSCEKEYDEYEPEDKEFVSNEDLNKCEEIESKYAHMIYNEMRKGVA